MKKIYSIITVGLIVCLLSSCATKMRFAGSSVVPGASGEVKIKKDDNNNYSLTINVLNLAEAKDLTPSRRLYVVWSEVYGSSAKNIGQIAPSSSLLSKTLKGELKATSTAKPSRIFITAEDDANIQYPGSQMVLSTQ